jgi:hypothetical protein
LWVEFTLENNPSMRTRANSNMEQPFIEEIHNFRGGAINIPNNTRTEGEFFELFYGNDVLEKFVEQTNLKVSK